MAVAILLLPFYLAVSAPTLKGAIDELHSASPNWFHIGLQLDVPPHVLENIDHDYPNQMKRLTQLLIFWMNNATPSWKALIKALKADSVGQKRLAEELEKKYCKQKDSSKSKYLAELSRCMNPCNSFGIMWRFGNLCMTV